ncbi:FlgN protein [Candidatus Kryptobacter tengchongensis]|uniref:FlgN protein n=1 Tax=Kryptobacter tengchongensis TaxID=1643429 RepID=A0A916PE42_KRYT1|nr:flagellar export chaperone FlgN [Candidatus Kryptobacter tengchongensis]CUS97186.1 FlgN protein [Candidatus Kryptobacter tengchongensis]CUU08382.1 FlgN protein [Candidatus Kryptobacter tengchongensis]
MQNDKIKSLLLELKEKFKLLRSIVEEKQKAIIEFDSRKLESVLEREESLLGEISTIEAQFVAEFGRNIKTFIEGSDELRLLRDGVESEVEKVRKLNAENRYLISYSLSFIVKLLELYGAENKINAKI